MVTDGRPASIVLLSGTFHLRGSIPPLQVTRAMRFSSFPSAAAYSAFSARLPAISAHQSAQRTRSRFGVVVATCLLCCTLLFSLSALHDKPCFSCRITLPCFDYLYPTSGRTNERTNGRVSGLAPGGLRKNLGRNDQTHRGQTPLRDLVRIARRAVTSSSAAPHLG